MTTFRRGDRVRLSPVFLSPGDPDGTVIGFSPPEADGERYVRVRWDSGLGAQFAHEALTHADERVPRS